jgi:hypothetical protein
MAGPFTKVNFKEIADALYKCSLHEAEIEKAEACDVDCQEFKAQCQMMKSFLTKVNSQYRGVKPNDS